MLARANRVVKPSDFRTIVRRGRRISSPSAVVYRFPRDEAEPCRFGFIISRAVGNAVERNLLRRRMRAVCREIVDAGGSGSDVVFRALPGAAQRDWTTLSAEMHAILDPALIR